MDPRIIDFLQPYLMSRRFPGVLSFICALIFCIFALVAHADTETVVIGDSLTCGSFGKHLTMKIKEPFTVYCAVASAPRHWLLGANPTQQVCQTRSDQQPLFSSCEGSGRIPSLLTILNRHRGAHFIISLGMNSLQGPAVDDSYKKIAQLVHSYGSSCEWIGPPHLNPVQSRIFTIEYVAKLEKNLSPFYFSLQATLRGQCSLIDSRPATADDTPGNETVDGVHRTEEAGRYWSEQIQLRSQLP